MAVCRNCGELLRCRGIYWLRLECIRCGYIYKHKFKTRPNYDDLLEEYAKEPWNKGS